MSRNLIVISTNREIAKVIEERVLQKIQLGTGTHTPTEVWAAAGVAIDLLVLDESSYGSRQAALRAARTFRKELDCPILLLTCWPVKESEGAALVDAVEGNLDAAAIPESRDLLIRLLYRRFRGGQARPGDAAAIWKLMEARAVAILLGTLFRLLPEVAVPSAETTTEYRPEQLAAELNSEFLELTGTEHFSSLLAKRLLTELPPLLWVYLVESLINRGRCELESFGTFEKKYDRHRLSVVFVAKSVLSELMMPDMNFRGDGQDALAIQICGQNAIRHFYEIASAEVAGDITLSRFGGAVRDIRDSLIRLEAVSARKLSAEEIWGHEWRLNSWLGVFARALAFASYYAVALNIGRAIRDYGKKEVPEVGTFSLRAGRIQFEASVGLVELIEANPQVVTAGA
jgi:hypothetical protein